RIDLARHYVQRAPGGIEFFLAYGCHVVEILVQHVTHMKHVAEQLRTDGELLATARQKLLSEIARKRFERLGRILRRLDQRSAQARNAHVTREFRNRLGEEGKAALRRFDPDLCEQPRRGLKVL